MIQVLKTVCEASRVPFLRPLAIKHLAIAIFYCVAVVMTLPIMIPALILILALVYLGHIGEWLDEHIDFPWLNGPYRAFIDSRGP